MEKSPIYCDLSVIYTKETQYNDEEAISALDCNTDHVPTVGNVDVINILYSVGQPMSELEGNQDHFDSTAQNDAERDQIGRMRELIGWLHTDVKSLASDHSQSSQLNYDSTSVLGRIEKFRRNVEEAGLKVLRVAQIQCFENEFDKYSYYKV